MPSRATRSKRSSRPWSGRRSRRPRSRALLRQRWRKGPEMNATEWATVWVFLALLVFIGILIYMKVPGMLVAALDKRAEKIRADLEEARRLRAEAEALLKEY